MNTLVDRIPAPAHRGPALRPAQRAARLRWAIPLIVLLLVAGVVLGTATRNGAPPATMLGASGAVDGGLARINGIIPLESDDWAPDGAAAALAAPVPAGAHRVRILLELTALDPDGLGFSAADYRVGYVGAQAPAALWASPAHADPEQGEVFEATLVFDIPDRAIELFLSGPGATRLSLGTGHHSG